MGNNSLRGVMNAVYRLVSALKQIRERTRFLKKCKANNSPLDFATIYPENYEKLNIGANIIVNDAYLDTIGEITIGDDAFFGWGVKVLTGLHPIQKKGIERQQITLSKPVFIGAGVWIASYAVILPGSVIGENSVVSAGSVVGGTFPPGTLIAGNPAKIIKSIDFDADKN